MLGIRQYSSRAVAALRRSCSSTRRFILPDDTHPRVVQENLLASFDRTSRQRIAPTTSSADLALTSVEASRAPCWLSPEALPVSAVRFSDGSSGLFEACPGRAGRLPKLCEAVAQEPWPSTKNSVDSVRRSIDKTALDVGKRFLAVDEPAMTADWGAADAIPDCGELATWLSHLQRYGVAMLTNLPTDETALVRLVEKTFGSVRGTIYGAGFSIRAVSNPNNLAFSSLGLQLHTDLPFYSVPPGVQFFHCLEAAAVGGETIVCDGFAAAELLRERDPDAFRVLTKHRVQFYDLTPAWHLEATHPTIKLRRDGGAFERICFNQRVRDSWRAYDPSEEECGHEALDAFYAALGRFEEIVESRAAHLEVALEPGEVIVTDNWRVLHSRRGFEGSRRFEGTYADWDALGAIWRRSAAATRVR